MGGWEVAGTRQSNTGIIKIRLLRVLSTYHAEEDEVFQDSEAGEEHVVLGTEAEGVPCGGEVSLDIVAIDPRLAAGRGEQPCQH